MSDTKAERLAGALNDFIRSSPDVEAAAVVSFDGLAMASALPVGMDEDRLGAMSAALLSLGEQAAIGLGRGEMRQLFVEGDHGFVFLMSAKDQAVLAAVTNRAAKIGFMLFEARRAAEVIGTILHADADAHLAVDEAYGEAYEEVAEEYADGEAYDAQPVLDPHAALSALAEQVAEFEVAEASANGHGDPHGYGVSPSWG